MVMTLLTRPKKTVATVVVATDGSGDTTDIQTGIDLLPATGGVVYIKEGTYDVANTGVGTGAINITTNNVALMGSGRSTIIEVSGPGGVGYGIYANGPDNLLISDLYIHGDGVTAHGLYLESSSNSFINRVWVENCVNGIQIGGGLITISNCFSYRNQEDGIKFSVSSSECILVNNHCYENEEFGISVTGNNNVISQNICTDNDYSDTATYSGIVIGATSNYNIVANNRCRDNDRYEIHIVGVIPTPDKNLIHGNICIGTDHVGAIQDDGTNTVLADNIIA